MWALLSMGAVMFQHSKLFLLVAIFGLTGCNDDAGEPVGQPVVPLESGLQTVMSGGVERQFFLALTGAAGQAGTASVGAGMSQVAVVGDGMSQVAAHDNDADRPLIFALHGYTGRYTNFVGETRVYDLIDVIGDHAVFVAPQALEDGGGNPIWGGEADLDFFVDMLREFSERGLEYDNNKIFLFGHSNGAGFAHELACKHGDIFRGLAAFAGNLTSNDCIGSVAVMFMHGGDTDPLGALGVAEGTRQYWVLYNGWDPQAFVPAFGGRCDDFSFPDQPDNLPYPVVWCLHDQGHSVPDFGGQVAWDFLSALPEVARTDDSPPGGGAEVATPPADTTLTFQVDVPAETPRPIDFSASLRVPSFIDNPTCSAPDVILGGRRPIGGLMIPGQVSDPITIPITFGFGSGGLTFPSDWAVSITIYVEGGSTGPIPTPGIDYSAITPITLVSRSAPIVVSEVLVLEPGGNPCGI